MPSIDLPTTDHHTGTTPTPEGSNAVPGDEVSDMEHLLDLFQSQLPFSLSPLELKEEMQKAESSWNQDGDLQDCGQLESRWVLWQEFMKEYSHLDAWLRLAEEAFSTTNSFHVTYQTAKEELRKCERLRQEAGPRLVQLDSLTRRNRKLIRLFQGAMQARLLASARECGRRWDDVNAKLESITGRLQLLVSEWEGFEAQREELALWLADMDVRLSEVDQLTGNTCEKMRQLQSFQECVCVNSGRVNALLQRGEALIQHSEPSDAQHIESRLLELLQHCSRVYNNIARTHTRLLSMRLVFEDDWILSQATDSGCPSESLLEDEGTAEKQSIDLIASSNHHKDPPSPLHHPPPPPSSPTHDHLGLEWDPSVDIGRSVSRDDADSSYFSASTGLCQRDGLKRWSYLSSFDSQSDISADTRNREADLEWLDCAQLGCFLPVAERQEEALVCRDQWKTSTPDRQDDKMVDFDGSRVQAWLRVQSTTLPERSTSCSKAVQTDGELKCYMDGNRVDTSINSQHWHDDTQLSPSLSHDLKLKASSDWTRNHYQSKAQEEQELHCCKEPERLVSEQSVHHVTSSSNRASYLLSPALIYLLLAAALALLAYLTWAILEPPCHRSNRMSRTFHLTLRYVNGPPPT
ncbi:nesprin-2 [Archocentrus centrarchus]|uniref:nesprin-2 n=1 Tax=Archocentrus centrarchus TaxID=63155 RepID=UPI0011E9E151|nr:nesprin-2-like [Archocentrus centrarchus]